MSKYKMVNGKKIPRSKSKRKTFFNNYKKQVRKPIEQGDTLMFGKYRLKKVSEVKEFDPAYYKWLSETFTIKN